VLSEVTDIHSVFSAIKFIMNAKESKSQNTDSKRPGRRRGRAKKEDKVSDENTANPTVPETVPVTETPSNATSNQKPKSTSSKQQKQPNSSTSVDATTFDALATMLTSIQLNFEKSSRQHSFKVRSPRILLSAREGEGLYAYSRYYPPLSVREQSIMVFALIQSQFDAIILDNIQLLTENDFVPPNTRASSWCTSPLPASPSIVTTAIRKTEQSFDGLRFTDIRLTNETVRDSIYVHDAVHGRRIREDRYTSYFHDANLHLLRICPVELFPGANVVAKEVARTNLIRLHILHEVPPPNNQWQHAQLVVGSLDQYYNPLRYFSHKVLPILRTVLSNLGVNFDNFASLNGRHCLNLSNKDIVIQTMNDLLQRGSTIKVQTIRIDSLRDSRRGLTIAQCVNHGHHPYLDETTFDDDLVTARISLRHLDPSPQATWPCLIFDKYVFIANQDLSPFNLSIEQYGTSLNANPGHLARIFVPAIPTNDQAQPESGM
jgi:hypothetical protein